MKWWNIIELSCGKHFSEALRDIVDYDHNLPENKEAQHSGS
jgi:hypothetical protein